MSAATTLRWVVTFGLMLSTIACGDDDDGSQARDSGMSQGDSGGSGGSGNADSGITPLGDGVAGRECMHNSECGAGMCVTQITGGALIPEDAPGGYCTGQCLTDADCGAGGACIGALQGFTNGQCFAKCTTADDCRDGYLCAGGIMIAGINVPNTCRPKPKTDQLEDDVAGKPCTTATDCPGGTCLTMRGGFMGMGGQTLPDGYCSGACLEDSHCGAGGVCSPSIIPNLAGSCYQDCSSDADCTREGYRCREVGNGVQGCDPFPDPLPDNTAGKACTADADCGGETDSCASELPMAGFGGLFGQGVPAPDGYCTQICADDADCGAGGTCVGAGIVNGRCFKPCAGPTDCRTGYTCQERGGMGGMPGMATGGDAGMSMPVMVCAPEPPADTDAGN